LAGGFDEAFCRGGGAHAEHVVPERLEDWIGDDNPVRVIDVFVDELDLGSLGFGRVEPRATGRPGYHSCVLLKLYIYGYLNRTGARQLPFAFLSGRIAARNGKPRPTRPREPNQSTKPRKKHRDKSSQPTGPVTRTKHQAFLHSLDPEPTIVRVS
jgi:hypothetical protein